MSMFDRLDRIASRTVDQVNSIPFVLTPMAAPPNGRPGPDPARPIVRGKGVFDYIPAAAEVKGMPMRAPLIGSEPSISVDLRQLAGVEPKAGDIVSFPAKPDLGQFKVLDVERDGMSRLALRLAKAATT